MYPRTLVTVLWLTQLFLRKGWVFAVEVGLVFFEHFGGDHMERGKL
jgi:hypothetical protein